MTSGSSFESPKDANAKQERPRMEIDTLAQFEEYARDSALARESIYFPTSRAASALDLDTEGRRYDLR